MINTLSGFPTTFTAGDAVAWVPDTTGTYDVDNFTFQIGAVSENGQNQITIPQDGILNGLPQFVVVSNDSKRWVPDTYFYQLYAFDSEKNRTLVCKGYFVVLPDFMITQEPSQNYRTFKAISDLLEGRANDDISSTVINGKSIQKMTTEALIALHTYYTALTNKEANLRRTQSGLNSRRTIRVRFGNPG